MRHLMTGILLMVIISISAQAQQKQAMEEAEKLVENKKYKSAFELLQQADPDNQNPEILIQKTDIVLNYFVTSISHMMFALKDLEQDENVMQYRKQGGDFSLFMFDVDSLTRRMINQRSGTHPLYKNLADFWFDVYLRYGNSRDNQESALDSVRKYARMAISTGADNYTTYYQLALCYTMDQKFSDAIPLFNKSISKNDTFATSHYNLAYAYLYNEQQSNALVHANRAYELYKDSAQKADAARMAGVTLMEMNRPQKAKVFFEKSLVYAPNNYNTLQNMLQLYLAAAEQQKADSTAMEIFALAPDNPRVADDLSNIYQQENKTEAFVAMMKKNLANFSEYAEIRGNIYFAMAKVRMKTKPKEAEQYLLKAKESFAEELPDDHYVFDVIRQALEYVKNQERE